MPAGATCMFSLRAQCHSHNVVLAPFFTAGRVLLLHLEDLQKTPLCLAVASTSGYAALILEQVASWAGAQNVAVTISFDGSRVSARVAVLVLKKNTADYSILDLCSDAVADADVDDGTVLHLAWTVASSKWFDSSLDYEDALSHFSTARFLLDEVWLACA